VKKIITKTLDVSNVSNDNLKKIAAFLDDHLGINSSKFEIIVKLLNNKIPISQFGELQCNILKSWGGIVVVEEKEVGEVCILTVNNEFTGVFSTLENAKIFCLLEWDILFEDWMELANPKNCFVALMQNQTLDPSQILLSVVSIDDFAI